jgi:hypothetical protein
MALPETELSAAIQTDRSVRLALIDCVIILLAIPAWFFYEEVVIPYLFQGDFVVSVDRTIIIVLIFYFFVSLASYFRLRGVAKKREAAKHGMWGAQAAVQPDVSQALPSNEVTVEQDTRQRFLLVSFTWLFILALLPILLFYMVVSAHSTPDVTYTLDPMTWVTVLLAVIIQIVVYLIYQSRMVSRLEVTPEGLASIYQGQREALPWAEMRSFARYAQGRGKYATTTYEVAGTNELNQPVTVRWRCLSQRSRATLRPEMTHEEYVTLLDRVNSHIVAKTKLPLLDFDAKA